MKTCTKCKKEIDGGSCSLCRKEYLKNYRQANKERLRQLNRNWRNNNKEYYKQVKYAYYCSLTGRLQELNRSAKRRAVQRKLEFDLTVDFLNQLWEIQNGKCAITGLDLIIPQERNDGKASPFSPSIDRIDIKKGYTTNNVRIVCYIVNCSLHDYGLETFDRIANAYINNFVLENKWLPEKIKLNSTKQKFDRKYRESTTGIVTAIFHQCKKHAKESNLEFNLLKKDVKIFLEKKVCALTNIPFCNKLNYRSNPFRPSLDRIDCKKGYIKDNVRLVCVSVNFCLNEFGEDIFKKVCTAYLENKSEGNLFKRASVC